MSKKAAVCADDGPSHEFHAKPISRLKRYMGLSVAEKILLFRALFLVSAIRLGLCLLPFRVLQRFTQKENRSSNAAYSVSQYVWAVRAVSRYVPGATCLTQALAAQALLTQSGRDSHIEFAVKKDERRRFLAHAWLVCGEHIVIGRAEAEGYQPLEAVSPGTPSQVKAE